MKEIVNVNIGNIAFNIDEDAYQELKHYFEQIQEHLADDTQETMQDIETRIAEILQERNPSHLRVITLHDVQAAMRQMGDPECFDSTDAAEQRSHNKKEKANFGNWDIRHNDVTLRRSKDRILGGVCAGIAEFTHLDTSLVRLLTIILVFFGGLSFWAYIILWIIIPEKELQA